MAATSLLNSFCILKSCIVHLSLIRLSGILTSRTRMWIGTVWRGAINVPLSEGFTFSLSNLGEQIELQGVMLIHCKQRLEIYGVFNSFYILNTCVGKNWYFCVKHPFKAKQYFSISYAWVIQHFLDSLVLDSTLLCVAVRSFITIQQEWFHENNQNAFLQKWCHFSYVEK